MRQRRDAQRGRVYRWEERIIAPRAASHIDYDAAQAMVDALWAEQGLRFPPKVEPLPPQARRRVADADRLRLRLPKSVPSWVLLHELAHSLSSTAEGGTDGHGPCFMGLYVQLLVRYLRLPETELLSSLLREGIAVDPAAKPVFLDDHP